MPSAVLDRTRQAVIPAGRFREMSHEACAAARDVWSMSLSAAGLVLSLAALALLLTQSVSGGKTLHTVSFLFYGLGLVSMFGSSALYHGYRRSQKVWFLFHQFDYYAIGVMIAGAYTPLCLIALRGHLGITILSVVWAAAIVTIVLKALRPRTPKWVFTLLFIVMGWLGLGLIPGLVRTIGWSGVLLCVASGLFFSVGALVFNRKVSRPVLGNLSMHDIWHVFILAGSSLHFVVVYRYLLPL